MRDRFVIEYDTKKTCLHARLYIGPYITDWLPVEDAEHIYRKLSKLQGDLIASDRALAALKHDVSKALDKAHAD